MIVVAAACSLGANERSASFPRRSSDKIYTFQQIEKQKTQLKDKVVRIEIKLLLGDRNVIFLATGLNDTSPNILPTARRRTARLLFAEKVGQNGAGPIRPRGLLEHLRSCSRFSGEKQPRFV